MKNYQVSLLPLKENVETVAVLKKLAQTHRYLAELKGIAATIPNETILINTLGTQEAKDSSEIENIITTNDDLYKTELFSDYIKSPAAKEIRYYVQSLKKGFSLVRNSKLLTCTNILAIHQELEQNDAGFRKLAGTELKNQKTKETIYTPPQNHQDIINLMSNLEQFINDDSLCSLDPLIKMAIIHFQFESIHPFYDGNGRTGRIINILYLVIKDLLNLPVLYLSRYITRNKGSYYKLIQKVRDKYDWESWILFILDGLEVTSKQTIWIINEIKKLMMNYKHNIRKQLPKIYSQDLLNNLFSHPYTKIGFIQEDLQVTRLTATKYLEQLQKAKFLEKHKIGKHNYYINVPLMNLFTNIPDHNIMRR